MPVPEIDRLAHEILDILGDDALDRLNPDEPLSVRDRARVALVGEMGKINAALEPLYSGLSKRLKAGDLGPYEAAAVWNYASCEFQAGPVTALLGLYAALERAEMQERATPTPNLDADKEAALPLRGRPDDDMSRHQEGEGT